MLNLQRARTRCGNGGAGDGGRARGAATDAGGDRYGRVQQGTVAESAEGGEGDGQGKEVAGRHDGRVKAAARTDTMREWGGRGMGDGHGEQQQTQVAIATGECKLVLQRPRFNGADVACTTHHAGGAAAAAVDNVACGAHR